MQRAIRAIWGVLVAIMAIGIVVVDPYKPELIWPVVVLTVSLFVFSFPAINGLDRSIGKIHNRVAVAGLIIGLCGFVWLAYFSSGAQSGVGALLVALGVSGLYVYFVLILAVVLLWKRYVKGAPNSA